MRIKNTLKEILHETYHKNLIRTIEDAVLKGVSLENAILNNTNLAHTNLVSAKLVGANLEYTSLENAHLQKCVLKGANLKNAYIRNADLRNANLKDACLEKAILSGADLTNADLTNTDLTNACLMRAYLKEANFNNTKIHDLVYTNSPPIRIETEVYSILIWEDHIRIGCEFHAKKKWFSFSDKKIGRLGGKEALYWWRIWKEPLKLLCEEK